MSTAIFPVTYLAPVSHFALMLNYARVKWDIHEHYHKQFYYNRCEIYGANGSQKLIIPVKKRKVSSEPIQDRTSLKDVEICYTSPWQKMHWRSFEAAYWRSPYFEFYEPELFPLYMGNYQPSLLLEWNVKIMAIVCKCIGLSQLPAYTTDYLQKYTDVDDFRSLASSFHQEGNKLKKYHQVFEEKHGFLPDLSIIDLLFCEGPQTKEYLIG